MTFLANQRNGIFSQRGFRLRCFLGSVLLALAVCSALCITANAQIDVPGPFRVSHFQGIVVSPEGKPISDAEVVLVRDGKTVATTRTESSGRFRIEHVEGPFMFRMHVPHYSVVNREVIVRFELATDLGHNKLYVILGPGACSDDCSSVFTNKKDFDRTIRRNTRHNR
jgi:Carboxypeptidase regulatory-like domain